MVQCFSGVFSSLMGIPLILLGLLVVWSLIWKVVALWTAARKKQIMWFIVLVLVNTAGLLEILYIYVFSKMKLGEKEEEKPRRHRRRRTSRRKRRR